MPSLKLVVFDFETTGLSPQDGDRPIEVGAVRLEKGKVVDRFQELMNPGRNLDPFITQLTGITNKMLKSAPPCQEVLKRFIGFLGADPLVAHNASFEKRFMASELERLKKPFLEEVLCTMMLSRRLLPDSPDHKLGTLARHLRLQVPGTLHRALADAETSALLLLRLLARVKKNHGITALSFEDLLKVSRTPVARVDTFFEKLSRRKASI